MATKTCPSEEHIENVKRLKSTKGYFLANVMKAKISPDITRAIVGGVGVSGVGWVDVSGGSMY